ncbi:MAG: MGMT family protein [Candidatus Doudnabacteria bacterium]|nr:MGMT family protein [Candidatus Doudnabacteria bacterium]
MRSFKEKVILAVGQIPKGRVASYGQIAAICGNIRAARQVGAILKSVQDLGSLPWWRVLNSQGNISIKGNFSATKSLQKILLEEEGVEVTANFSIEMEKYRWKKK